MPASAGPSSVPVCGFRDCRPARYWLSIPTPTTGRANSPRRRGTRSFASTAATSDLAKFSAGLRLQRLPASQVLVVDSNSDDGTRELASAEGYQVFRIDRRDFNHGGTRQLALKRVPWASIAVYLTQDAFLATPDSLLAPIIRERA